MSIDGQNSRLDRWNLALRVVVGLFLCGAVLAWPGVASAGSTGFRCPATARLVSLGQSPIEVRARCGEPDEARTTVETRTVRETVRRWVQGVAQEVTVEHTIEVPVDEWTYDFGRHRFLQFLRFESGRLISVREGGKGSDDAE